MMVRIDIALALALLTALPAQAAAVAAAPLDISGDVPVRCKMAPPTSGASANAIFRQTGNGGALTLTGFVGADARTRAVQASIQVAIACSGSHVLTVTTHGGLTNQTSGSPSPDFANHADYALTARWGGLTQSVTTSGAQVTIDLSQANAAAGSLGIDINLPAGRGPLAAGTYTDEIIIQLNAQ